jgi:hypothetical protein
MSRSLIALAACILFAGPLSAQQAATSTLKAAQTPPAPQIVVNVPPQPAPTVNVTVPQQPPPQVNVTPQEDEKLALYTLVLAVATVLLAVATFVIALLTKSHGNALEAQNRTLKDQSKQLRRTVDSAEAAAGPIIVPAVIDGANVYAPKGLEFVMGDGFMTPPYTPHTPHLRFMFENHGKTPAFLRVAKYELRLLSEPVKTTPDFEKPRTRQDRDVISGETRYGGDPEAVPDIMEMEFPYALTAEEFVASWSRIKSPGAKRYYFFGSVMYDDIFDYTHTMKFCFKLMHSGGYAARAGGITFKKESRLPDPPEIDEPAAEQA